MIKDEPFGLTELPFEQPGRIFRSPMPFGRHDPEGLLYYRYREHHIATIVLLAEDEECMKRAGRDLKALYKKDGFRIVDLPITDAGIPDPKELRAALSQTIHEVRSGHHIAIHCSAGIGRTGLFAACLARVLLHLPGQQAIEWVRRYIPGAVETPQQRQFVNEVTLQLWADPL